VPISTPRLIRSRHGVYFFRVLVPAAHIPALGRERRISLRTKDAATAKIAALRLSIIVEQTRSYVLGSAIAMKYLLDQLAQAARTFTIKKGEVTITGPEDAALYRELVARGEVPSLHEVFQSGGPQENSEATNLERLVAMLPAGARPAKRAKLGDLLAGYQRHLASESLARKTESFRRRTIEYLVTFVREHHPDATGRDWYADEVQSGHIQDFLDWYPSRPDKRGRPLTHEAKEVPVLMAATKEAVLSALRLFFNYCEIQNAILTGAQPVTPAVLSQVKRARTKVATAGESYQPFSKDEIQAIFEPRSYLAATKGDGEYFWVPLLSAFTGARQGELVTLTLGRVGTEAGGVHVLRVLDDAAKNANSIRVVPIADRLIELGFLEYVQTVRNLAATLLEVKFHDIPLFPFRKRGATFDLDPGKNVCRFFGEYLKDTGLKKTDVAPSDRLKVFHSFRHTVVSILDAQGVSFRDIQKLIGHATQHAEARREVGLQFAPTTERYAHSDIEGLHGEFTMYQRLKAHYDKCVHLPLDFGRLKAAAEIVRASVRVADVRRGKWKSGWHPIPKEATAIRLREMEEAAVRQASTGHASGAR
jgi:integrase